MRISVPNKTISGNHTSHQLQSITPHSLSTKNTRNVGMDNMSTIFNKTINIVNKITKNFIISSPISTLVGSFCTYLFFLRYYLFRQSDCAYIHTLLCFWLLSRLLGRYHKFWVLCVLSLRIPLYQSSYII